MGSQRNLADEALRIWRAGVAGVAPEVLLPECLAVEAGTLLVGDDELPLREIERLVIVGGGKAVGEMAAAVEHVLGPQVAVGHQLVGLVNIPAGCRARTNFVRLHEGRPFGVNEPSEAGERGVDEMLRLVGSLGPRDLCLVLLTGGASALMPAPIAGLSLADKAELTRELSARGATINELNAVRRELSRVKGGGLARACRAGRLVALILSDVLGDDLETIASGPTVMRTPTPQTAIALLEKFDLASTPAGGRAIRLISQPQAEARGSAASCDVTNLIVGNNAAAVDTAGVEAEKLGYSHAMIAARESEGAAEEVGRQLARMARQMRDAGSGPDCLISGGEPTVTLAPKAIRGLGGRNQQLALAALAELDDWRGIALVSGGTDGEDGPTDAAGAWVDEQVVARARELKLDPRDYLARNDAYRFFEKAGGLLETGPTGTNVCDVRVVTVKR